MFCELALNTKSSKKNDLFTYSIPSELEGDIAVGQMVIVPFGPRKMNGIVINIHDKKPEFDTKNIEKIIDLVPLIDEKQVDLARFISEHYWCGLGQTVFTFLPANLRKRKTKIFKDEKETKKKLKGNLEEINDNFSLISSDSKKSKISFNLSNFELTSQQEKSLDKIFAAIEKNKPATFLLHGVTNSGKTEVYLRTFAKVLENSGGGIFVIPEISLTPQSVKRFEEVFGKSRIALVHSKLSISQRLKTWIDIKTGKKDIVVGSRSAIFAPVKNLKLIIVDEEHDLISFKSDQTPRYELHAVAEKLAELNNAVLIFGSGTPLITSYKRVIDGDWEYLSMSDRVDGSLAPQIKIVNMEDEKKYRNKDLPAQAGNFSEYLVRALDMVLRNKKQALLFINRRGMASFVICESCKKVSICDSCTASLVYHSVDNKLWCHHCGRKYPIPTTCPDCGGLDFRFLGKGTERIESEIKNHFPYARIERMDRDTMDSDEAYESIFTRYKKGEIDILIGTQMIVHGWDIPSVDLAAVISIDESMLVPDYSSEEKVFQLLVQLAGRTGRSSARGMMVLQTSDPDSWIFDCVVKNDYLSFAKRELALREKFGYPPFGNIIKLSLGGENRETVEKKAFELAEKLNQESRIKNQEGVEIIGPVSPLIDKKYGRYWKTIVIKLKVESYKVRDEILNAVPKDWVVDVDPISLL